MCAVAQALCRSWRSTRALLVQRTETLLTSSLSTSRTLRCGALRCHCVCSACFGSAFLTQLSSSSKHVRTVRLCGAGDTVPSIRREGFRRTAAVRCSCGFPSLPSLISCAYVLIACFQACEDPARAVSVEHGSGTQSSARHASGSAIVQSAEYALREVPPAANPDVHQDHRPPSLPQQGEFSRVRRLQASACVHFSYFCRVFSFDRVGRF